MFRRKQKYPELFQAAESGDVKAQLVLGGAYSRGKGLEKDFTKAKYWFEKAADAGSPEAKYYLALMHIIPGFQMHDMSKAAQYLLESATAGLPDAQYDLGVLLYTGPCDVEEDLIQARYWIGKAAEAGHEAAKAFWKIRFEQ